MLWRSITFNNFEIPKKDDPVKIRQNHNLLHHRNIKIFSALFSGR
jgi:hypothetical protein